MDKMYAIDGLDMTGTAEEVVRELHKGSRAQAKDDETWMAEASQRVMTQSGHVVRTDTAEHFVDDLLAADLLHKFLEK